MSLENENIRALAVLAALKTVINDANNHTFCVQVGLALFSPRSQVMHVEL